MTPLTDRERIVFAVLMDLRRSWATNEEIAIRIMKALDNED